MFQIKRPLPVPKEGPCHGKLLIHLWIYIPNRILFLIYSIFVIFRQITQQVFVAEEGYREANNSTDVEALTRANVEKLLGVVKQEQLELSKKLKLAD